MGCGRIERNRLLHDMHGLEILTEGRVNLGLGKTAPLIASLRRSDLRRNVLIQARVGEQLCPHHVNVIFGNIIGQRRDLLAVNRAQLRHIDRGYTMHLAQPLGSKLCIVVVQVSTAELGKVRSCLLRRLLLILVNSRAPIQRGRNFLAARVIRDLLVE